MFALTCKRGFFLEVIMASVFSVFMKRIIYNFCGVKIYFKNERNKIY